MLKKNLALTIPHSQALRLLTDVLPINKLIPEYNLYIICENSLITERIQKFCEEENIFLLGITFRKLNSHNFIKRLLANVRAYVFPFKNKKGLFSQYFKTLS